MKPHVLLMSVVCALPLTSIAAEQTAVLLAGTAERTEADGITFHNGARAVLKRLTEQTIVTAERITFHRGANMLVCTGHVTASAAGNTFKADELRIELGSTAARVHTLNQRGTLILGQPSGLEDWTAGRHALPGFADRLAPLDVRLKNSSKLISSPAPTWSQATPSRPQ